MRFGYPGLAVAIKTSKKGFAIISLIGITIVIYQGYPMLQLSCWCNSINKTEKFQHSLQQALLQLKTLKQDHTRLMIKFKEFSSRRTKKNPTKEYENLRRRIFANTKELWYYVNHQLRKVLNEGVKPKQLQSIVKKVADRKRWLLLDQDKLPALDGHKEWRRHEAVSLSGLIQRRLHYLQNPPDCRAAKKLVCQHDSCGFGCNIHHIAYCLVTAYALERTLILAYFNWWSPMNDWTKIFHPLSGTCTKAYNTRVPYISVNTTNATEIYLPLMRKNQMDTVKPYSIPKDLAQRITRINGDPYSWWIGQMVKYIFKLRKPEVINATIAKINFKSPVVGVHIRTTDKLVKEAKYHHLDEYMSHVDDYYEQLELTRAVEQRHVYLATDDDKVLKAAVAKYPQYKFFGDSYIAKTAYSIDLRYSSEGLAGFLRDVHMLSLCDYIVCTFSSNIGRLAYEMMQARHLDATNRITSLDHWYYFTAYEKHRRVALISNKEIAFNVGDLIEFECINDAANGTVLRTNDSGRIPWYKTEEHLIQHAYPEYKLVPLYAVTGQNISL